METLTNREQQIANAVARGLTNRQVAAELGISPETVKRHLATIFDKLAIRNRVGLALHVVRSRQITLRNADDEEAAGRRAEPGVMLQHAS